MPRNDPTPDWDDVRERFVARLGVAAIVVLSALAFVASFVAGLAI